MNVFLVQIILDFLRKGCSAYFYLLVLFKYTKTFKILLALFLYCLKNEKLFDSVSLFCADVDMGSLEFCVFVLCC